MLLQLRRVVYLLVLLHFCLCVVNAASEKSGGAAPKKVDNGKKVDDLITEVEKILKGVEKNVNELNAARSGCVEAAENASDVTGKCNAIAADVEKLLGASGGIKKAVEMIPSMEEAADSANNAAAKAKEESANAVKIATNSAAAAKTLAEKAQLLDEEMQKYEGLVGLDADAKTLIRRRIKGYEMVANARVYSDLSKGRASEVTQEADKAEKKARAAIEAANVLKEKIAKVKAAAPEDKKAEGEKQINAEPAKQDEEQKAVEGVGEDANGNGVKKPVVHQEGNVLNNTVENGKGEGTPQNKSTEERINDLALKISKLKEDAQKAKIECTEASKVVRHAKQMAGDLARNITYVLDFAKESYIAELIQRGGSVIHDAEAAAAKATETSVKAEEVATILIRDVGILISMWDAYIMSPESYPVKPGEHHGHVFYRRAIGGSEAQKAKEFAIGLIKVAKETKGEADGAVKEAKLLKEEIDKARTKITTADCTKCECVRQLIKELIKTGFGLNNLSIIIDRKQDTTGKTENSKETSTENTNHNKVVSIPTVPSSSGTISFNISGLSDSGSVPALARGPLLSLALLYVLGYTLVC